MYGKTLQVNKSYTKQLFIHIYREEELSFQNINIEIEIQIDNQMRENKSSKNLKNGYIWTKL